VASRGLKDEIKKRNPFASAEQEAALNLARTYDRLQSSFTREVGDRGSSRSPGSGSRDRRQRASLATRSDRAGRPASPSHESYGTSRHAWR
jgi:hypothetical protein